MDQQHDVMIQLWHDGVAMVFLPPSSRPSGSDDFFYLWLWEEWHFPHNLNVLLNSQLLLEVQVTAMSRGSFGQIHLVHQLYPLLDWKAMLTVTQALVISWLDYCNMLYLGLPLKTIWKFQLFQNVTVHTVTETPHARLLLHELHGLPVTFWA